MSILERARFLVLSALAASPLAAQAPQEGVGKPEPAPFLYGSFAGPEALLVDQRDAGLLRALRMLDERLLELPSELGGDVPEPVIRLLCDALLGAYDLELRLHSPEVAQSGAPPVEAQLRTFGTPEQSASIARGVETLLGMLGVPSEPVEGESWQRIPMPFGSLLHGKHPGAGGREGYFVAFGPPRFGPPRTSADLPQGVAPVLLLDVDGTALKPYLQMVIDMAGAQGDILFEFLDRFGLMSDEMLGYRCAFGQGSDRSYCVLRTVNGVAAGESLGWLVKKPLTAEELRLLPADAVQATITRMSLDFVPELLDIASEAADMDLLGKADEVLGVHLKEDFFAPLGDVFGFYTADSTGGGGILSAVAFAGVDDTAKLEQTLDTLSKKIDMAGANHAKGYIAVRSWERGGVRCRSLQFPGVPVPFEPSLAIAGKTLWVGVTRQALEGALAHAEAAAKGDAGLVGSARFKQAVSGSTEDLLSLGFTDSARLVREGYGMATLVCAAIANTVRSPHDPERDPGSLLPPFAELVASARPALMLGRIEGKDIVVRGEGDRSMVVTLTSALGNPALLLFGMAAAASAAEQAEARHEMDAWQELEPPKQY